MSDERIRDRGKLFENTQKRKPSQPDMQGDCNIAGTAYEIRGWRRDDQLTISLAPPRGDRNTYLPDVFRGTLEAAPAKPVRANPRGAPADAGAVAAWSGDITSDDAAYTVRAFQKQGQSGLYFTLSFDRLEPPKQAKPVESQTQLDPTEVD
jgi:hypothetical protein